jgi:outer membrane receptor protein involved in Fe transport
MRKIYLFLPLVVTSLRGHAQTLLPATPTDSVRQLAEMVVTASRTPENILKSPISIELLDGRAIRQSAAPSYFDALEYVKGVQLLTSSLGFKVYNTRCFANPTNVRFVQLVDGVDNQAPHIGSPIGATLAPTDLDIDHAEIIPGVASVLYGMNALNGMVNLFTKSPYEHQGLSFQQKTGINHVNSATAAPHVFSESTLRWARAWRNRWAVKVNVAYQAGYDWIADDASDLNPNANVTLGLTGLDNPAYDPVNSYGNESPNRRNLTLGGKRYAIARTGYYEKEVSDFSIKNFRGDAGLYYKTSRGWELSYTYRFAFMDNLYQRTNRFRLEGYRTDQHVLTARNATFQFKAYVTSENTGRSYNIRSVAENTDRYFKTDNVWFADFGRSFSEAVQGGATPAQALSEARQLADAGRPLPGTPEFAAIRSQLSDINNWDIGAALRVQSWLYHAEGQIDLTKEWLARWREKAGLHLLAGVDYRLYEVVPDGNYFINPTGADANLTYQKYGGFIQATKYFWNSKVKANASLRADKNQYFALRYNPRLAVVYSPVDEQNFRISYQNGYRFPSLFEAFSNVNSGGVKRVGGLPIMSSGIFENSYYRTSVDAFQAAITNDVNLNGLTTGQAIQKNKGLIRKNDYTYIEPEYINSFEVGYKGLWLQKRLYVDVDFYYNQYRNFMAQVEVNLPKRQNANPDSLALFLSDRTQNDRYRLWTNSKTTVFNYGASAGARYRFYREFSVSGNVSFARLDRVARTDGLEEAFNTPRWITNVSLNNPSLTRHLGFGLSMRWQEAFLWESSLATGIVPAYTTVDGQVTYSLLQVPLQVKLGGTNLLNRYYTTFLAGPSVGGFYYLTLTYGMR